MPHTEIANISFRHLKAVGLRPDDKPARYSHAAAMKATLISEACVNEVDVVGASSIHIVMSKSDYVAAIINELYFGAKRVATQCENVRQLDAVNAQAAWLVVTAYYACFFIANDIARASGRFTINLSHDELSAILRSSKCSNSKGMVPEANNSFFANVKIGEMDGEVQLELRKHASKPHLIAWSNFHELIRAAIKYISDDDSRIKHFHLIEKLLSGDGRWERPSSVRNTWNYTSAMYFAEYGDIDAKLFRSLIKSEKSCLGWGQNNLLYPDQKNLCASIAYLFHILKMAHGRILDRLSIQPA